MIETKSVDLAGPVNQAGGVICFTAADDMRWAGMIDLPAHASLPHHLYNQSDLYIVQGELIENASLVHTTGTFLKRSMETTFISGSQGARLFRYHDSGASPMHPVTVTPRQLRWHEGGAIGMQVASLVDANNRLILVSWTPGTRMPFHDHPFGEEILVLTGELQDQRGRYPAGTWQRLHPETGHAPYSETHTLVLLRNGHLRA